MPLRSEQRQKWRNDGPPFRCIRRARPVESSGHCRKGRLGRLRRVVVAGDAAGAGVMQRIADKATLSSAVRDRRAAAMLLRPSSVKLPAVPALRLARVSESASRPAGLPSATHQRSADQTEPPGSGLAPRFAVASRSRRRFERRIASRNSPAGLFSAKPLLDWRPLTPLLLNSCACLSRRIATGLTRVAAGRGT